MWNVSPISGRFLQCSTISLHHTSSLPLFLFFKFLNRAAEIVKGERGSPGFPRALKLQER